jgi:hypothetical protein
MEMKRRWGKVLQLGISSGERDYESAKVRRAALGTTARDIERISPIWIRPNEQFNCIRYRKADDGHRPGALPYEVRWH